jgi:hypothetical protein
LWQCSQLSRKIWSTWLKATAPAADPLGTRGACAAQATVRTAARDAAAAVTPAGTEKRRVMPIAGING